MVVVVVRYMDSKTLNPDTQHALHQPAAGLPVDRKSFIILIQKRAVLQTYLQAGISPQAAGSAASLAGLGGGSADGAASCPPEAAFRALCRWRTCSCVHLQGQQREPPRQGFLLL